MSVTTILNYTPAGSTGSEADVTVASDGLYLTVTGLPFTQTFTSGDPLGDPSQLSTSTREIPYVIPPASTLRITLNLDGTVTIDMVTP